MAHLKHSSTAIRAPIEDPVNMTHLYIIISSTVYQTLCIRNDTLPFMVEIGAIEGRKRWMRNVVIQASIKLTEQQGSRDLLYQVGFPQAP